MSETPEYVVELQKTFEEYKKALEDKSAEGVEKQKKIEIKLDSFETINQANMAKVAEQEKSIEELKELNKEFEKKLLRSGSGDGTTSATPEEKAFGNFLRKGQNMAAEDRKTLLDFQKSYLRTDSDADGGFLVPTQWATEIERTITEISALRPYSRVITIGTKSWFQPVRTTLLGSAMTAEAQALIEAISAYGGIEIFVKKITADVPVTNEALEDSAYNLESEVRKDILEEFDRKEGQQMVNGAGANEMRGIMVNPLISSVNSGIATDISADSLIEVSGELKSGYKPIFSFNRKTLARIRKFKDGSGAYIWTPSGTAGLAPGVPNELNGYQYIIVPDMPDIGAGLYPVLYGDFKKFYIVDRIGLTVLRDVFTQASTDKVLFIARKRTGCDVVVPEAFVKLKCSA